MRQLIATVLAIFLGHGVAAAGWSFQLGWGEHKSLTCCQGWYSLLYSAPAIVNGVLISNSNCDSPGVFEVILPNNTGDWNQERPEWKQAPDERQPGFHYTLQPGAEIELSFPDSYPDDAVSVDCSCEG
jgi:hypothetical protein